MSHPEKQDNSQTFSQSRFVLKLLLSASLVGCFVIFSLFYLGYSTDKQIFQQAEYNRLNMGEQAISSVFSNVTKELLYLASASDFYNYLDEPTPKNHQKLERALRHFSDYNPEFAQIRFLDDQGQEKIRINHDSRGAVVVPEAQLQNKARRYYFRNAFALKDGEVFVSPLDLNTEKGVVERPLKPMIRFAVPIYDHKSIKRGVLLLNYFGQYLLDSIRDAMSEGRGEIMLVNADGYWLMSPNPDDNWGFMLHHNTLFSTREKRAWEDILVQDRGAITTPRGQFSWKTIHPLEEGHFSSTGTTNVLGDSSDILDHEGYFWKLITKVPQDIIGADIDERLQKGAVVFALYLLILSIVIYILVIARKREHAALEAQRRNEQKLRNITSELADGLIVTDCDDQLTMMNREAEKMLGWTEEQALGKKLTDIVYGQNFTDHDASILDSLSQGKRLRADDKIFHTRSDDLLPVAYTATPLLIDNMQHGGVITFQDITERKKTQEELRRLATRDALTGLFNRREIDRRLQEAFNLSKRYGRSMVVLMLDIDFFKKINDNHGHQAGDAVLQAVGGILAEEIRDADSAGRYGGEEFILLLPETTASDAVIQAERIRKRIEATPINHDGIDIHITMSLGIASFPDHADELEELINAADTALYIAKDTGRNQVQIASPSVPA